MEEILNETDLCPSCDGLDNGPFLDNSSFSAENSTTDGVTTWSTIALMCLSSIFLAVIILSTIIGNTYFCVLCNKLSVSCKSKSVNLHTAYTYIYSICIQNRHIYMNTYMYACVHYKQIPSLCINRFSSHTLLY